jgi:hypothetical protein
MNISKKTLISICAGVLILTTLACTSLDSILPNTKVDDSDDTYKFSDDFSKENSGWEIGSFDGGGIGYTGGIYFVSSTGSGSTMWGAAGRSFEDVIIDVDAEQVSAPSNNNNDYGIACRLQQDGGGYYGLISGDGFYSILRESGGDSYDILVDWKESNHIRQGNGQNHLGLSCVGSKISLFVNGQLLAETSDSMYDSGDIGFTATSYEPEGTEVHFDNLTVR